MVKHSGMVWMVLTESFFKSSFTALISRLFNNRKSFVRLAIVLYTITIFGHVCKLFTEEADRPSNLLFFVAVHYSYLTFDFHK